MEFEKAEFPPIERVTRAVPVIDSNHANIHDRNGFSLIGTIDVAQTKTGIIEIYVPGNDTASLVIASETANADLTFTAKAAGLAGNDLSIELLDPQAESQTLEVVISDGTKIEVYLATNDQGGGTIISTSGQVAAAVNAHPAARLLMTAAAEGDGTGVVAAVAHTHLAGGNVPSYVHFQALDVNCNAGPGTVSLLEDYWLTSAVGASVLVPKNHHRNSPRDSELTVKALADAGASTGAGELAGTTLAVLPLHGTGVGVNKIASDNGSAQEWILQTGKKYLLAFSHTYAGTVKFGYNLFWYEEQGA